MHDFKKMTVWKKGMKLVKDVYNATDPFPKTEVYGLTNQIRRSAVSIPSNISEGSGRSTDKDFKMFLHYAYGSSCELYTQILIALSLNFGMESELRNVLKEIDVFQKMTFKFIEKLN